MTKDTSINNVKPELITNFGMKFVIVYGDNFKVTNSITDIDKLVRKGLKKSPVVFVYSQTSDNFEIPKDTLKAHRNFENAEFNNVIRLGAFE
jgi:hypothetical protein